MGSFASKASAASKIRFEQKWLEQNPLVETLICLSRQLNSFILHSLFTDYVVYIWADLNDSYVNRYVLCLARVTKDTIVIKMQLNSYSKRSDFKNRDSLTSRRVFFSNNGSERDGNIMFHTASSK